MTWKAMCGNGSRTGTRELITATVQPPILQGQRLRDAAALRGYLDVAEVLVAEGSMVAAIPALSSMIRVQHHQPNLSRISNDK